MTTQLTIPKDKTEKIILNHTGICIHRRNISEGFTGHYDYVLCYALVHEPKSTKNKPTPAKCYTCVSDEEGRGRKGTRVSGL